MLSFVMWIDLLVKFFMEDIKDYNTKDWKKSLDHLFWWLILHFYHSFVNVIRSLSFCKQRKISTFNAFCFLLTIISIDISVFRRSSFKSSWTATLLTAILYDFYKLALLASFSCRGKTSREECIQGHLQSKSQKSFEFETKIEVIRCNVSPFVLIYVVASQQRLHDRAIWKVWWFQDRRIERYCY